MLTKKGQMSSHDDHDCSWSFVEAYYHLDDVDYLVRVLKARSYSNDDKCVCLLYLLCAPNYVSCCCCCGVDCLS